MTTAQDIVDAPVTLNAPLAAPLLAEDAAAPSLFQEINERRARIENAELLQHLRGL
jgi:hypothetical protein